MPIALPEPAEAPLDLPARENAPNDVQRVAHSRRGLRSAWDIVIPVALVLLIGLTFIEALHAGFVDWDDDDLLLAETQYRVLTWQSLGWMFTTTVAGHFQPLTWLSYWLDWQLWNRDAFGFHVTNVTLHIASALTFYFLAQRLLVAATQRRVPAADGPPAASAVAMASGFATVLFALHPLRAESVAWIAERRDVLSGVFFLSATWFYLRFVSSVGAHEKRFSYGGALVCMLLSLLANASAVTLPLVFLVLDLYPLRRKSASKTRGSLRALILEKVPLFAISIAGGVIAIYAQWRQGAMYALAEYGLAERFAQACYGLAFYVWKTVLPTNLGPLYEIPSYHVLLAHMMWWAGGSVLVSLGVIFALRRKAPALFAATLIYLIQITPVLGLLQSGPQLVADRYSYLSCLGIAVLGGGVLLFAMKRASASSGRLLIGLACIALISGLHLATLQQCAYWHSPLSLWHRGLIISPDSTIANASYADALHQAGNLDEAFLYYRRALELNPRNAIATAHLGDLLGEVNEVDQAMSLYRRALELDPKSPGVHAKLAHLLVRQKRVADAVQLLRDRTAENPSDLRSMEFLADLLSSYPDPTVRNPAEAAGLAERLNRQRGGRDGVATMFLATALIEGGKIDQGLAAANRCLHLARVYQNERLEQEVYRRLDAFRQRGLLPTP